MEGSDEELYRRMKKGDRAAFAELYERREPGIYRTRCMRREVPKRLKRLLRKCSFSS